MTTSQLRELTLGELDKKITQTRQELLQLRLRKQLGQVEKSHRLGDIRRDVARLITVRNQKAKA